MPITSHFIGITLKSELFVDLFKDLKKYFNKNNLSNIVVLQNLESVHLTLYYLDKSLDEKSLSNIKSDIKNLNQKPLEFSIIDAVSFQGDSTTCLVYLPPTKQEEMLLINDMFKTKYPNDVVDNKWVYMPHITLFKVKNLEIFSKYESEIIDLVLQCLKKIKSINVSKSFNLYSVDSNISPEKQTIVY